MLGLSLEEREALADAALWEADPAFARSLGVREPRGVSGVIYTLRGAWWCPPLGSGLPRYAARPSQIAGGEA